MDKVLEQGCIIIVYYIIIKCLIIKKIISIFSVLQLYIIISISSLSIFFLIIDCLLGFTHLKMDTSNHKFINLTINFIHFDYHILVTSNYYIYFLVPSI